MKAAINFFPGEAGPAGRLAAAIGIDQHEIATHCFPDGESLVRVDPATPKCALLYCSLDHPNVKLIEILFAASALRANGANWVVLIAPYLGYMRQDTAFRPGEAVSQRVIGCLIASAFNALITVDAHLHRTTDLAQIMPGIITVNVPGTAALSNAIDCNVDPIIVGPDIESKQWVDAVARSHNLDVLVGRKLRAGDRDVSIEFDGIERVRDRYVVLVDDVISSGATLKVAAEQMLAAGARSVEVIATHCLASEHDLTLLEAAGVERIRSTDSILGPTTSIELALVLADGIKQVGILA